jgi:hypothetical protein
MFCKKQVGLIAISIRRIWWYIQSQAVLETYGIKGTYSFLKLSERLDTMGIRFG